MILEAILHEKTVVVSGVGARKIPIYCVETERNCVALTFDAAWGNEDTKEILDILQKHHAHATFFMTGEWVKNYPEDVRAIYKAGHDLGNHSAHHKNMSQLSKEACKKEVQDAHDLVKALTGYNMTLFRPPYGDYDDELMMAVEECGYFPIQWSVDSLDWKDYGKEQIITRVCENEHLENGAIILCHNGTKYTAKALDTMLARLAVMGYEIVPVSELILRENYHIDVTGKQIANDK